MEFKTNLQELITGRTVLMWTGFICIDKYVPEKMKVCNKCGTRDPFL